MKEIIIDDTTLREGEQTPGVVFSIEDKISIAKYLSEIGIQRIEAGFPASSKSEWEAVKSIVKAKLDSKIFGFARAVKSDIDAVIDCDCYGIVMSFPPSDIHLKYKLKIDREEYLRRAIECVTYAKEHGLYVTYSAEDSTRTDIEFLKKVFKIVVENGVNCARIVDTLGVATPSFMKHLVSIIKNVVSVPIEVHCHNDHGLALANSLAAIEAGASVISSSINGLGERAGLAATEEVIVALHNLYDVKIFKTEKLYEICKFIEKVSGVKIPASKPVTGENVFTHTSGIHQDAILKNVLTYEPYPPELVGQKRRFVIGKLSGSHIIKAKLIELGYNISEEDLKNITNIIKEYSQERKSALSDIEVKRIADEYFARKKVK